MKSLLFFLLVIIGILTALDDKLTHSKLTETQKTLDDAQGEMKQQATQLNALNSEIAKLKEQIPARVSAVEAVSAGAPATPAPGPAAPAKATDIVTDYSNSLTIIEGSKGVGTGFLCTMEGHTYVITNAHVLCDNPGLKITSIKGTVYTMGASAVAVGHDVVRIEVTGTAKAFVAMDGVDTNAKIGDAVTILGNAGGAGVVTPVNGTITGLGPDLIEVDAPFVKGNSGSPIIHVATGKVLGVATYILERKMDDSTAHGAVQTDVRRFGYRLDDIKQWEQINWQLFYAQSAQVTDMETLSGDFIKMFNAGSGLHFSADDYASPAMQRTVRQYLDAASAGGRTMSVADRRMLVENFLSELRSITRADILAFNRSTAYDYFRQRVDEETRFRDDLYKGLTRTLENTR